MADDILANLAFDLGLIHTGVEVPGFIVFPDVIEAEPIIFIEPLAGFWRTMDTRLRATRMVAEDGLGLWPVEAGLPPPARFR